MLVCLSSGAAPRYAKNIFHALAQPPGSRLQFRYDESIVGDSAKQAFEQGTAVGQTCLLAYLDLGDPARRDQTIPMEIIPCRYGILESVEHAGTVFVLVFVLTEFAYARSLPDLNTELRIASANTLPLWENNALAGQFCLAVNDDLRQVIKTSNLSLWEQIVTQIAERHDFQDRSCFYTVRGLYQLGATHRESAETSATFKRLIPMHDDLYDLAPGHDYELQLYQFYPINAPAIVTLPPPLPVRRATAKHRAPRVSELQPAPPNPLSRFTADISLALDSSSDALTFTTAKSLAVDSPYDIKIFRFRTGRARSNQVAILSILQRVGSADPSLDFDLPIKVEGARAFTLIGGALLGLLVAVPDIVEVLKPQEAGTTEKSALSHPDWSMAALYGVIYVIAGILAAFGIGKIPGG